MLWRTAKARRGLSADTGRALANTERTRGQLTLYAGFAAVETRPCGERSGVAAQEEQDGEQPRESAADGDGVGVGIIGAHNIGLRSYSLRRANALKRGRASEFSSLRADLLVDVIAYRAIIEAIVCTALFIAFAK